MFFDEVKTQLQQLLPLKPQTIIKPWEDHDSPKQKIEKAELTIKRYQRLKRKENELMVYFYLGKEIDTNLSFYKHLSKAKRCMASRIYHIFEPLGIEQIGRTTGLSTRRIYRDISEQQYLQLRREAQRILTELETFAGEDLLASYMQQIEAQPQTVPQYDAVPQQTTATDGDRRQSTAVDGSRQRTTAGDGERQRPTETDGDRRQSTSTDDEPRPPTAVDDDQWYNDLFSI